MSRSNVAEREIYICFNNIAVFVCMNVCVYVCLYVRIYVYMYVHINVCI